MIEKELKSKTILYITHSYNNFIKSQIEEISKNFKKVYVLVRHKPVTNLSYFKFLSFLPYFQELNFHSKKYKFDLNNLPSNIEVIPTPVWYLPFLDWFYRNLGKWHLKAVKRTIKKHNIKFDIVHSHMLWSAGYVGLNISQEFGVPFVVTGHGTDVYKLPFKNEFWNKSIKGVLRGATKIITVSENNKLKIEELKLNKDVVVIPNGFDEYLYMNTDKYRLRKELNLPKNKEIFITVANMEPVKGHEILVDAITKLKNDKFYFIFVGGGSLYTKIKKLIESSNLIPNVLMTNYMQHDLVVKYELASDYFLLPSYNEGVPTVMFEAFASKLPFISTRVGGIPEIAKDFNSILINPGKVDELANAIDSAVKKNWDLEKIRKYSENFTWKNISDRIVKIYLEVLNNA